MNIHESSKKIVQYMLAKVIEHGSLCDSFFIRYDELAQDIGLESENYCRICCQYLNGTGRINIIRKDDDGSRLVELKADAIDFLETT